MTDKPLITYRRLREVLDYDPETGIFRWKISRQNAVAGEISGTDDGQGYVRIGIDRRLYRAHRLAWLYMTGNFVKEIDHANNNRSDNRFCNLRMATRTQNNGNSKRRSDNTSGRKGVYWSTAANKWVARIGGTNIHLGVFPDLESAAKAYAEAAKRFFGEFTRPHG